jgi:hypothetical protein
MHEPARTRCISPAPFTSEFKTASAIVHCAPLQVQDESGRGVPAGFMITSEDTTEVVEQFLRVLQQGVRENGGVTARCPTAKGTLLLATQHCPALQLQQQSYRQEPASAPS